MKIERSQVTKLVIKDIPRLDPVTVFLEDLGPNQGKMIVECYGRSWSAYWGGMGGTLDRFLRSVSADYLTGCLARGADIQSSVYDPDGLGAMLKREVLKHRFKRDLSQGEAYRMMYEIECMDFDHPHHISSNLPAELLGTEWFLSLPKKVNPDWAYLLRIVQAIQAALNETTTEASNG